MDVYITVLASLLYLRHSAVCFTASGAKSVDMCFSVEKQASLASLVTHASKLLGV